MVTQDRCLQQDTWSLIKMEAVNPTNTANNVLKIAFVDGVLKQKLVNKEKVQIQIVLLSWLLAVSSVRIVMTMFIVSNVFPIQLVNGTLKK